MWVNIEILTRKRQGKVFVIFKKLLFPKKISRKLEIKFFKTNKFINYMLIKCGVLVCLKHIFEMTWLEC